MHGLNSRPLIGQEPLSVRVYNAMTSWVLPPASKLNGKIYERERKVNKRLILWISLYSTAGHLPVFNFSPSQR